MTETAQTVAAGQLRAFVERIERLQEERKTIADNISDVFKEATSTGFDKAAIKDILKIRRKGLAQHEEHSAIVELYLSAMGIDDPRARAREAA